MSRHPNDSESFPATCPNVAADPLEHQVRVVARRLQEEFPLVEADVVLVLLHETLHTTRNARVQQFRTLLAERHVRDRLRSGAH